MGGVTPLGYAIKDRKLVIVPEEAETVGLIVRRYRELGSVRLLKQSPGCSLLSQALTQKCL
jgi:site-specific DNA recombinase